MGVPPPPPPGPKANMFGSDLTHVYGVTPLSNQRSVFPSLLNFLNYKVHRFSFPLPLEGSLSLGRFATGRKHKTFLACALCSKKSIDLNFGQVYLISCKTGLNVGCKTLTLRAESPSIFLDKSARGLI